MAKSTKQTDRRIERAYGARCNGVEIWMLDLTRVWAVGCAAVAEGVDDIVLGDRIEAFVQTIRQN